MEKDFFTATVGASVPNPTQKRELILWNIKNKNFFLDKVGAEAETGRNGQTETDCPPYCIFQWRLHIPEIRPHDWRDGGVGGCLRVGATIVGLNYLVEPTGGGVQQS